jgi:hypothetical protein
MPVFETGAFNHSATLPKGSRPSTERGLAVLYEVRSKAVCFSPISATLPKTPQKYNTFLPFWLKMLLLAPFIGPIVYRLGHKLFKLGSRVRLPVGSQTV